MKEKIHPKYYQAKVICACGNTFVTGSTKKELRVEICSACHPFYTGKKKIVDTAGRVTRFEKILEKKKILKKAHKKNKKTAKTSSKKKK